MRAGVVAALGSTRPGAADTRLPEWAQHQVQPTAGSHVQTGQGPRPDSWDTLLNTDRAQGPGDTGLQYWNTAALSSRQKRPWFPSPPQGTSSSQATLTWAP